METTGWRRRWFFVNKFPNLLHIYTDVSYNCCMPKMGTEFVVIVGRRSTMVLNRGLDKS